MKEALRKIDKLYQRAKDNQYKHDEGSTLRAQAKGMAIAYGTAYKIVRSSQQVEAWEKHRKKQGL